VDWEGRRRPFDLTIANTGAISDGRVLHALAEELDVDLGLPSIGVTRAELVALSTPGKRPAAPAVPAAQPAQPGTGQALLATWTELLDGGRMQVGDDYLAGTAKPARAVLSAATAAQLGLAAGGHVSVSTDRGALVLPVEIGEIDDAVVWVPTNAPGRGVRSVLGAGNGSVVTLTNSDAPPVLGAGNAVDGGGA
jgi:NADH-quinone oxidoreductase subunit G